MDSVLDIYACLILVGGCRKTDGQIQYIDDCSSYLYNSSHLFLSEKKVYILRKIRSREECDYSLKDGYVPLCQN